jgi:dolichol kinase
VIHDALLTVACGAVLGVGLGGAVLLSKLGLLARTYVRDLVHVGTGVWVLGWPLWSSPIAPIAITAGASVATLVARPRVLREALTGGDERWSGVAIYVVTYAVFTAVAFLDRLAFPAAAALLALSLGDGIGGAVGRRYGARFFRAPGGKQKSLEGSLTVGVMAALGVALASSWFGADVSVVTIVLAGAIAAIAEAAAPRGTDNAILPACVWLFLRAFA